MKVINKLASANKTCPFLRDYMKIDLAKNEVASEFLKKFSGLCPV